MLDQTNGLLGLARSRMVISPSEKSQFGHTYCPGGLLSQQRTASTTRQYINRTNYADFERVDRWVDLSCCLQIGILAGTGQISVG